MNHPMIPKNRTTRLLIGAVIAILVISVLYSRKGDAPQDATDVPNVPSVELLSVAELAGGEGTLTTVGTVESSSKVDLKSQASGQITSLNVRIGDDVAAGQVIATLDNATIAAQLAQAQAAVAVQQANLDSLLSGSRPEEMVITGARVDSAKAALASAEEALTNVRALNATTIGNLYDGLPNALSSAASTADDAVNRRLDGVLQSGGSGSYSFTFLVANSAAETDAIYRRGLADDALDALDALSRTSFVAESAADDAVLAAESHLVTVRDMLSATLDAIDDAAGVDASTRAAYESSVSGARTAVNAAISSLTALRQGIASQRSAATSSEDAALARVNDAKNALALAMGEYDLRDSGATDEQVRAQRALVQQASANALALQAQLGKTVVRSPITGSVVSVPVRTGDVVAPGQSVASIVNTSGLEVRAYVGSNDVAGVRIGARVDIEGGLEGVVTRIGAGVDATTQKIEVGIGFVEGADGLVEGQVVNVRIATVDEKAAGIFVLPLSAVRSSVNGSSVFVVRDGNVEEVAVSTGRVEGGTVRILDGLDGIDAVVASVRGLAAGDAVEVR